MSATPPTQPPPTEFYVGYQRRAPRRLARFLHRLSFALVAGGLGLALFLTLHQQPAGAGSYDTAPARFEGLLTSDPYPTLWLGAAGYDLVAPGKRGLQGLVAPFDGHRVELHAALIRRGSQTMLEVAPESLRALAGAVQPPGDVNLGAVSVVGEIVDSKCFLGVMKPGRGKLHRDCAIRCISGGAPPALLVETTQGEALRLLLVDAAGRAVNDRVLAFVGEPVAIDGEAHRRGQRLFLWADPSTYHRLE